MKRNLQGLVLVLLLGVQGLLAGNALAYNSPDKVWLDKGEIVEGSAFPRSAMDD